MTGRRSVEANDGYCDAAKLDDKNIRLLQPLIPPACLLEEFKLSDAGATNAALFRKQVADCVAGTDDRLLVVVGPCSIHDPKAALEYATKLKALKSELEKDLLIVMRVYFEKPRTTIGWKGLINDPDLDGSFKINKGLRVGRQLLIDIIEMGLPTAVEFLDTITPQFLADLVCWGAIGARTIESQVHRELTSGLSMPIGLKNGTSGDLGVCIDGMKVGSEPHSFLSVTKQGLAAIVHTMGNPHCHIVLRGSNQGPNYSAAHVKECEEECRKAGVPARIMVDCSHGNSNKDHNRQPIVAAEVGEQVAAGSRTIVGVMIESNLVAGNQKLVAGKPLTYGQSITDACIDWPTTETTLRALAVNVQKRRAQP